MLLLQKDLIDLFRRDIKLRIGTTLPLAILIVGVIGMGLAGVTFVDALISLISLIQWIALSQYLMGNALSVG